VKIFKILLILFMHKNLFSLPQAKQHYLFLSTHKVHDIAFHSKNDDSKNYSLGYGLGYRYFTYDGWSTALSTEIRKFKNKNDSDFDGQLCLHEEISMLSLIYYPLIAASGFKLSYLYPIEIENKTQIKKNKNHVIEVGGSLCFSLYYAFSQKTLIGFSLERWRGFNSSRYQGMELTLSINHRLST